MARNTKAKHNDQLFRKTFEEGFKHHFQNGLLQGSKAMCKVIFDKVSDETKTLQERVDDVKRFCGVLLGINVITENQGDAKETPKDDKPE